jgi:hypothetical protein
MNSKLRKSIESAKAKCTEVNKALQTTRMSITFSGFGSDEPLMSICTELGKVELEYHGMIMDEEHIIHYMENQGYITPNDFR